MPRTRRQISLEASTLPDKTKSSNTRATTRSSRRIEVKNDNEMYQGEVKEELLDSDNDDDDDISQNVYVLDGESFTNYNDFVAAKRKRNQSVLMKLGFGPGTSSQKRIKIGPDNSSATQRGLKSNKKKSKLSAPPVRSRRSSRISGDRTQLVALDMYVNDWHRDNTATIVTKEGDGVNNSDKEDASETFFKGRVNDGSALSLKEAIELNEPKWIHDDSEKIAKILLKEVMNDSEKSSAKEVSPKTQKSTKRNDRKSKSPTSVVSASWETDLTSKIDALSIDKEEWVCKVTPDRIYSVATHPNESKLICCAGDKQGYIGLWDVDGISGNSGDGDAQSENNGIVSLFHVHSRPICCLEWLNHDHMITASYDGSVRRLNAETGTFEEIFATYDDSDTTYLHDLGYGLDQGYRYWTQSVTKDPRSKGASDPCLFISSSTGDVFHIDLRVSEKQKITFHETVSEKKINSVSLHPNGTTLAASGNDGIVRLFDIRKFRDSRGSSKSPKSLCIQKPGLSVSSSFFSPSGSSLLTTSFANRLDLTEDAHLLTNGKTVAPTHSIRHNNQTGRWLTTFQAKWHPEIDIFSCGSMNKPRCMEIFDAKGRLLREVTGEALGSVMSRTCFHPSTEKLIMVGGNSSGRMVAIR